MDIARIPLSSSSVPLALGCAVGCGRRWVYWVLLVKRVELAPFAIEEVGVESACYARGLESLGVPPEVGGCFGKRLAVGVLEDRNLPLR